MDDHRTSSEAQINRRRFLRDAAVVAWSTPVIFTLISEHALAQATSCGTRPNTGGVPTGPCPNNPACPPSKPNCTAPTLGINCTCS